MPYATSYTMLLATLVYGIMVLVVVYAMPPLLMVVLLGSMLCHTIWCYTILYYIALYSMALLWSILLWLVYWRPNGGVIWDIWPLIGSCYMATIPLLPLYSTIGLKFNKNLTL